MKQGLKGTVLATWILIGLSGNGLAQQNTSPAYISPQELTVDKVEEILTPRIPKGSRPGSLVVEKPCEVYLSRNAKGPRPASGNQPIALPAVGTKPLAVPIPFDTGQTQPTSEGRKLLDVIGKALLNSGRLSLCCIQIEGHADSRGPSDKNMDLSVRRAQGVVNYLIEIGVKKDHLNPVGFGEDHPLCTEETKQCWERNRRVQFLTLGDGNE